MSGRWLAIDTATDLASVAVGVPPAVESCTMLSGPRIQATEIVEMVDRCLAPLSLRPGDLAGIVVGDGPGSFTGLRIGWAAAKGLAQERGLSLRAIPSLVGTAAGAAALLGPVPIAACFDALRGQVYGAVCVVRDGRIEMVVAPCVCTLADLIGGSPVRPRVVIGDGAIRAPREVEAWSGAPPLALSALRPTAASLLDLCGREGIGRQLDDVPAAEPEYGRPAEAQARWEARYGRPVRDPPRSSD